MYKNPLTTFSGPFSKAYWQEAMADFQSLRTLTFTAMLIAVCIALSYVPSIPITDGLRVTWGFLARSVVAWVGGPITALAFGAVEDTLSFVINPTGAYFPGYMLTTMLGTLLYALCLYRAPVRLWRIALAKTLTNVLNVVLGSLWSAVLYSKGYLYYMSTSAVKNTLLLPIQIIMLVVLFTALKPILQRMNLIPKPIPSS